ncbi:MAG: helix-turn-helix domain-containing protein [Solirubrobacteraceae bacterium]|nr:helix-turn-helix domain-containing protein [Solirubrobacteraceae bacterium]
MSVLHELLVEIRQHPELVDELRAELDAAHPDILRTAEQMAARWDCHPKTVERWCRAGRIPTARKIGRTWMMPVDATVEPVRPRDLGHGETRRTRRPASPSEQAATDVVARMRQRARRNGRAA